MPYKDPEKRKEYDKKKYLKNREKILQQQKEYQQTPQGIKLRRIKNWKRRNVIHPDFDLLHDVIYTLTSHCDYCGVYLTTDKKRTATTKTLHHLHISNVKDNVEAIVCHSCNVKAG